MWETQQTDKKDTPLARHSRKRGGGYIYIYIYIGRGRDVRLQGRVLHLMRDIVAGHLLVRIFQLVHIFHCSLTETETGKPVLKSIATNF